MNMQRDIFEQSEGDAWFARNAMALELSHAAALADPKTDPVLRHLVDRRPKHVLEVGASNGWRLDVMERTWGAWVQGVEPSKAAVRDGLARFDPGVTLCQGTAEALNFAGCHSNMFDCVVYGFCLYLCDRGHLPRIVGECDRVLKPGGLLVVYDFAPAVETTRPYHHRAGVTSFKRDHSELWCAFGYELLEREDLAEDVAVVMLRKP